MVVGKGGTAEEGRGGGKSLKDEARAVELLKTYLENLEVSRTEMLAVNAGFTTQCAIVWPRNLQHLSCLPVRPFPIGFIVGLRGRKRGMTVPPPKKKLTTAPALAMRLWIVDVNL